MQAIYILSIFGALFGAMYFFYDKMVVAPERAESESQKKYEEKKAARLAKKKN